ISTSPELGVSSPASMRSKVVLPQPEGPTSTRNSPSRTDRSMPSTALPESKCLVSACVSTVAIVPLPPSRQSRRARALRRARLRPRDLDQSLFVPLGEDSLALAVGLLDRVGDGQRSGRRLRKHRVQHPSVEDLVGRR